MTKEQEIKRNMELLDLTREEAEELYLSDHEDIVTPEMAEMERKAKAIKRYEKSDAPRKKTSKERKIDFDKQFLLNLLIDAVNSETPVNKVKTETEFSFSFRENEYSVKLIKHRPKKQGGFLPGQSQLGLTKILKIMLDKRKKVCYNLITVKKGEKTMNYSDALRKTQEIRKFEPNIRYWIFLDYLQDCDCDDLEFLYWEVVAHLNKKNKKIPLDKEKRICYN